MQKGGIPPREADGFPDTTQGCLRITIKQVSAFFLIVSDQGAGEIVDIRSCQVETLCTSGRDDMPGIPGQEKAAKTHGFSDKTAQGRNAHFKTRSRRDLIRYILRQAAAQFIPKSIIGPFFDTIIQVTLYIITTAGMGTHAA